MGVIPPTAARVPEQTAAAVDRRIEQQIEASVLYFAEHRDEIDRRLDELDREWDIERTLEANAASVSLIGIALAVSVSRRFLLLPAAVAGFLLQHALQGWCPPLPLFRRLGIRTQAEIEQERHALKALRGDYAEVPRVEANSPRETDSARAFQAAKR
jgi:hypothetical protein